MCSFQGDDACGMFRFNDCLAAVRVSIVSGRVAYARAGGFLLVQSWIAASKAVGLRRDACRRTKSLLSRYALATRQITSPTSAAISTELSWPIVTSICLDLIGGQESRQDVARRTGRMTVQKRHEHQLVATEFAAIPILVLANCHAVRKARQRTGWQPVKASDAVWPPMTPQGLP
jgi:hypothetical protein